MESKVLVVDSMGSILNPTTPSRSRRWIRSGRATPFWKDGKFCIRLNDIPGICENTSEEYIMDKKTTLSMSESQAYCELGTLEELKTKLSILDAYRELGTPEEIREAFDGDLKAYQYFGSLEELKTKLSILDAYRELGTPELIREVFDKVDGLIKKCSSLKKYKSLGHYEWISACLEELERFRMIGSVEYFCELAIREATSKYASLCETAGFDEVSESLSLEYVTKCMKVPF
jgi:hypothetical protein